MKYFGFFLGFLLVNSALAQNALSVTKCEDVLPEKTCTTLRTVAAKFKEHVGIVNEAVVAAFNHHKTRVQEVLAYVKEVIVQKGTNFTCFNAMSKDACDKLKDFALAVHVKVQDVNIAVREAIVNGATKATDIITKATNFLTEEISCEKFLGAKSCEKLKMAIGKFHEKADLIKQAIAEAVEHHYTKVKDILKYVQDVIISKAVNFTCTDALSEELCQKLDTIGSHLKLKHQQILEAVKEAIVTGASQVQQIYKRALNFFLVDVRNFTCEDLVAKQVCDQIMGFAKKLHLSIKDTTTAVKEAIIEGSGNTVDLYKKAVAYLKAQFSCDSVFGVAACEKINQLATMFGVHLETVNNYVRDLVASGVTSVNELLKDAFKFITDKWSVFGDEAQYNKRSFDDEERIKMLVNEAVAKVLDVILQ